METIIDSESLYRVTHYWVSDALSNSIVWPHVSRPFHIVLPRGCTRVFVLSAAAPAAAAAAAYAAGACTGACLARMFML